MAADSFQPIEKTRDQAPMTNKWTRCNIDQCGRPAIGSLERRYFCLDHFISYCYKRLDQCSGMVFPDADDDSSAPSDRFLRECAGQSADLVRPMRGLDNLDRARLFDIFLWASELSARRGTFKPVTLMRPDTTG